MYFVDDVWLEIKSFLLLQHYKWLFNKVLKELPKPKIKDLSIYREIPQGAIIKHFETVNYFKKEFPRLSSICFISI